MAKTLSFKLLKSRAVKGIAILTGQNFLLQGIVAAGFFALSVFLNQEEVGLFIAVSELVAILGYFSDIGLAASLIQKKEKPTTEEIRSTFTLQQGLVLFLLAWAVVFTPQLANFYHLSSQGVWLFRALLLSFFLASLKTIPSVLLERKLRFDLLTVVNLVETLLFYGLSVFLAWRGFGVASYAWAVVVRSLAGFFLICFFSPWPIGFAFEIDSLKKLLKFGVPYQANSSLAVVKDRLMNVLLWRLIGASGVGFLGWAQKWAQMPLRFTMDPVMRVAFPVFARLQKKQKELREAIRFYLFSLAAIGFPLLIGVALIARPLVLLIPRYQKWLPALVPLYLFCFNGLWSLITTPLTNAFSAVGKIKLSFKLMVFWTGLTWLFAPFFAWRYGYLGAAWALGLIPVSSLLVFWLAKREFRLSVWPPISFPLLASAVMAVYCYALICWWGISSPLRLFILIVSAGGLYASCLFFLARTQIIRLFRLIKNVFHF